jgi:hypothetical protein
MTVVAVRDCTVEGCDRGGRIARGLCRAHYDYKRAHGTTDIPTVRPYKKVHKITAADAERQVAICAECGPDSPVGYRKRGDGGYWVCRNGGAWRGGSKTPESRREYAIKFKYAITVTEYGVLLTEQNGVCAICSQGEPSGRNLTVDHDHKTGQVRGLLCHRCNVGIGFFADDPTRLQAAIAYLT